MKTQFSRTDVTLTIVGVKRFGPFGMFKKLIYKPGSGGYGFHVITRSGTKIIPFVNETDLGSVPPTPFISWFVPPNEFAIPYICHDDGYTCPRLPRHNVSEEDLKHCKPLEPCGTTTDMVWVPRFLWDQWLREMIDDWVDPINKIEGHAARAFAIWSQVRVWGWTPWNGHKDDRP